MSILLSNNPPHAGNLVDGIKKIEWRKKPLPLGKTYIYETRTGGGCANVIGEVTVWASYKVEVDEISEEWLKYGKVDREFLKRYAGGKPLYANLVEKEKRYEKPIPLTEFRYRCPRPKYCSLCKYSMVDETYPGRYDLGCHATIDHPPQSWCYCEDLKRETD